MAGYEEIPTGQRQQITIVDSCVVGVAADSPTSPTASSVVIRFDLAGEQAAFAMTAPEQVDEVVHALMACRAKVWPTTLTAKRGGKRGRP